MNTILVNFNSRHHTWLLYNLLLSFEKNTAHPERLTICINTDEDDEETDRFSKFAIQNIKLNLIFNKEERSKFLNGRLNNSFKDYMCDFNWVLNADTCLMTKNWDLVIDELDNAPMAYYIDDDGPYGEGKQYCFFPILSRKLLYAMESFFPPTIQNLGADVCLHSILYDFPIIKHIPIKVLHYKYNGMMPQWIYFDRTYFNNNLNLDGDTRRIIQGRIRGVIES